MDFQLFAKWFWGFDPQRWPAVSFSSDQHRDHLVSHSRSGDRILFVGTKGPETDAGDRGRLLGMGEIGRTPVDTINLVDPTAFRDVDHDERGAVRWPKSLPVLRAWRFTEKPTIADVLGHNLSPNARLGAVLLGDDDRLAVLAQPHEEVAVRGSIAGDRQRALSDAIRFAGPTTGPRPSTWSQTVTHDQAGPALTYAMRFGKRDVWKIGYAADVQQRLADVNKHIPFEVLGEQWAIVFSQAWPDAASAYEMEQALLAKLRGADSVGERVRCDERSLKTEWVNAIARR